MPPKKKRHRRGKRKRGQQGGPCSGDKPTPSLLSKRKQDYATAVPIEVWASIAKYLYLDEVLNLCETSKYFLQYLPPTVKFVLVDKSGVLRLGHEALKRFENVSKVYVYTLINEEQAYMGNFQMDPNTVRDLIPFLTQFPSLQYGYIGGMCSRTSYDHEIRVDEDGIRADALVDCSSPSWYVDNIYSDCLEGNVLGHARLVMQACEAFESRKFSHNLVLEGILPPYDDWPCRWLEGDIRLPNHRDDVPCQLCDYVCQTFPVQFVMEASEHRIRCISKLNRLKIALKRDPQTVRPLLTMRLIRELSECGGYRYGRDQQDAGHFYAFHDKRLDRLKWIIANGANIRDERIREVLLDRQPGYGWRDNEPKRAISKKSFQLLKELGFDVAENDFEVVDLSRDINEGRVFLYEDGPPPSS